MAKRGNLYHTRVGTTNFPAATSASISEIIQPDNTATTLTVTPNPGYIPGEGELLTAVNPLSSTVLPTSIVFFYDNSQFIGGVPVARGQGAPAIAPLTISTLAPRTHILTAIYSRDANFLRSTSTPVTLKIEQRDFTLVAVTETADPSITIETEQHGTLPVDLTSFGGFADSINLTCSNLPQYATCNPRGSAPWVKAGETVFAALDIDTDALLNYESTLRRPNQQRRLRNAVAIAMLLPITLFAARRRFEGRAVRLLVVIVQLALATFTGCSDRYPGHTPPGTYTFNLTGTGAATGITHSTKVTLIVTQ